MGPVIRRALQSCLRERGGVVVHVGGVPVHRELIQAALVHEGLHQAGVDVVEELGHVRGVAAHVFVQRVGKLFSEQLGAFSGHVDHIRRGARGHHGEDLGEEVLPVDGLDGLDFDPDLRVEAGEGVDGALAGGGVRGGAHDGDAEAVVPAARNVSPGEPRPRRHGCSDDSRAQGTKGGSAGDFPQMPVCGSGHVNFLPNTC
ncbi:hypothetical protein D9M72_398310 [compost metagenome]